MFWASIALILYALPVLSDLRNLDDEIEAVKDWMRSEPGCWHPNLAPAVALIAIFAWPIGSAMHAFAPRVD